jgi:replicative DNA helicase
MKTSELISQVEAEIRRETATIERNEQLLRLQQMAKEYDGDDRVVSSDELRKELEAMPPRRKFYTGFNTLDKLLDGLVTGESIFVSGITKHGKTAMCMELSVRLKDENPLWLSFEEKPIELMRKFHEKTGEYPHFFTPRQNERRTLEWIEKKIIEGKAKFGSNVVFLDHIGFVKDHEQRPGELEATCYERISREIHLLAVKWDVLFFHLGHLTKVGVTQQPDIENIKGSSAMSQEADLTILIWRRTERIGGKIEKGNETNLSLQANRRGSEGNVEFVYDNGRFLESEWEHLANDDEL